MANFRCPVCNKRFDPSTAAESLPFCTPRCRQIDLGRWLGEGYSVPHERLDEEEESSFDEESSD
jgi:endogenous inhibitor of DNA gyrase (YacG/DUF329 family)